MIGRYSWNLSSALAGMLLTFVMNLSHNVLMTSLLRSVYSFVCIFLLMYVIRFLLGVISTMGGTKNSDLDAADQELRGQHVDYTTPDETIPLQQAREDSFTPLDFKNVQDQAELNPDVVVNAVRHMTQE